MLKHVQGKPQEPQAALSIQDLVVALCSLCGKFCAKQEHAGCLRCALWGSWLQTVMLHCKSLVTGLNFDYRCFDPGM